jgi:hypothetical protein
MKFFYYHTITKENNKLTFGIYHKPTTIDSIIHNESCHPSEHKKSAINNPINRTNTFPVTQENKNQERIVIEEIVKNNGYQQSIINSKSTNRFKPHKHKKIKEKKNGPHLHMSALRQDLFRHTNLKIANNQYNQTPLKA